MNNKLIIAVLSLAVAISSCTAPRYLPKSDEIDINQYGSYINIKRTAGTNIKGELIAVDVQNIFVLTKIDHIRQTVIIPVREIKRFELRYAKPKHYGWTIPVYTLTTIGHSYGMLLTAPINLIVTISVAASGATAFKYSDKEMTYEKLKMFARYPQGIPSSIEISIIK